MGRKEEIKKSQIIDFFNLWNDDDTEVIFLNQALEDPRTSAVFKSS